MPASMLSTPTTYTSRYSRALSPPLSSAGSTVGPQMQSLKIVTRLAIEGHAKEGEGVPIKMYMKVYPRDSRLCIENLRVCSLPYRWIA